MRFKSGSITSGSFQGNGQAYRLGKNNSPSIIRIVQNANSTRFNIYALFEPFSDGTIISISSPLLYDFFGTLTPVLAGAFNDGFPLPSASYI